MRRAAGGKRVGHARPRGEAPDGVEKNPVRDGGLLMIVLREITHSGNNFHNFLIFSALFPKLLNRREVQSKE